jgi:predicted DNA-binding transcriptional regulator AlpA
MSQSKSKQKAHALTEQERRAKIAKAASVRSTNQSYVVPTGDRLIAGREVCKIRGLRSRMTLWRHIQAGTIPKPDATIHGRHYWLASRIGGAA